MFFKRSSKKSEPAEPANTAPTPAQNSDRREPVPPTKLRTRVDAAILGFATTAELSPSGRLIGQDRALSAIAFAAGMRAHDFNLFVIGPPASGKTTAVRAHLSEQAETEPAPNDWVYVNNFEEPYKPLAISLPPGRARELESAMIAAIDDLRASLPAAFATEDAKARRRAIDELYRAGHEQAFEELNEKAGAQNIAILRTPTGFTMAPVMDGNVVRAEVFANLPPELRQEVQRKIEALQDQLMTILAKAPEAERAHRDAVRKLNAEISQRTVEHSISGLRTAFANEDAVLRHLQAVTDDLQRNFSLFLDDEPENPDTHVTVRGPSDTTSDPRFRRYLVNVIVSREQSKGAPIHAESNPNYAHLIGRIEHIAQMGTLMTDFMLIKPGALHRANGGYLLLDARKLLTSPFTWEALKRAIKAREIRVEQPLETTGFATTQSLEPEPIPLSVKVILFGGHELYYALCKSDPDFERLFKIQAEFEDTIDRNENAEKEFASLIAAIAAEHDLKPLNTSAVARVIEEASRIAGDARKISIEIGRIADIVREANYWSTNDSRDTTARKDIDRAIDERIERADRMRDRTAETIERGIVLVDTQGSKIGQINALSVSSLGHFSFGRPNRITARVRMGRGRVTDIEREVELGGPLHSKGVMILWGYLAGKFANEDNLALAASLVFEQSYGGVDGDSASAAELFCLLSALSDTPIDQGIAVTGSVNQWGEVQAIGGVNEKIEGFFDICSARGLTGNQGVLIPESNIQHLMLREDVVKASEDGRFNIWGVSTVDEGIEILTRTQAGERLENGSFPKDSINHRVEEKLRRYAKAARMAMPGLHATGGPIT